MENTFYPKIGGAILATVTAAISLLTSYSSSNIFAGVLVIAAVILVKSAETESRKTGRTEQMKASLKAVKPGAELILISAALIIYSAPVYIAVSVIGLYSFSEIFSKSSGSKEFFGEEVRVGLLIIAFLGHTLNQYILFYGLLAIAIVAGLDISYMLYKTFKSDI